MKRACVVAFVATLAAVAWSPPASAQSAVLPSPYVARPLVLPWGTLRIDGGPKWPFPPFRVGQLTITHVENVDTFWHLNSGLTLSFVRNFEVGLMLPLQLAPDIDLHDPVIHALYGLTRGTFEVGLFGAVALPVEDDFEIYAGLPLRAHAGPVRFDLGVLSRIDFGDDSQFDLIFPLELALQLTPELFLGPETGVTIVAFDGVDVPLGVFGGYTFRTASGTLGDLSTRFRLHDVDDGVSAWQLMFNFDVFFDL